MTYVGCLSQLLPTKDSIAGRRADQHGSCSHTPCTNTVTISNMQMNNDDNESDTHLRQGFRSDPAR